MGNVNLAFRIEFRDSADRRDHDWLHPYVNKSDGGHNLSGHPQMDGKVTVLRAAIRCFTRLWGGSTESLVLSFFQFGSSALRCYILTCGYEKRDLILK